MALRTADELRARRRRWALLAVAVATAALVAAVAGRWERHRYIARQLRGMVRVERLVGPLDQPSLAGYRVLPQFDCLVYRRGSNLLALELCVDRDGRLVEAADRLGQARTYYSLRPDPGDSTITIDRPEVDRLLRRMGAIP